MDMVWRSGALMMVAVLGLLTPALALDANGNRSHDPNLRELTAELDGLRDLMHAKFDMLKQVIDERDRRYAEREAATKEFAASTSQNSKDAIAKAESAQKSYDLSHNDLIRKGEEQAKQFITRNEVDIRDRNIEEKFRQLEVEIKNNRETINALVNQGQGMNQFWNYLLGVLLVGGTIIGAFWTITRMRRNV